jgi:hypothetical protein
MCILGEILIKYNSLSYNVFIIYVFARVRKIFGPMSLETLENLQGRDHLEDLGMDGRIVLV